MSTADQSILEQIQRLSGALRQARDQTATTSNHPHSSYPQSRGRGRYAYNKYAFTRPVPAPKTTKSVEIGGQVFKASTNKLTRQTEEGMLDVFEKEDGRLWDSSPATMTNLVNMLPGPTTPTPSVSLPYSRPATRGTSRGRYSIRGQYKPRGRRHPNMSLVLNKAKNVSSKKAKLDKQCPFFSRTGLCSRGKSCRYQHDPEKVAICPRYLAGDCPSNAENCLLSHDTTLNRVPPCVHFQNNGRCKNGDNCIYPHVRVGVKKSICRDFAVLGYCEKGIDCENAHVRECPDFAETGECQNKRCKLPHVIRANRKNQATASTAKAMDTSKELKKAAQEGPVEDAVNAVASDTDASQLPINGVEFTFEGGDEFIPLTFVEESEEDEEETDVDEDEDENEEGEDETPDEAQGDMKVFG